MLDAIKHGAHDQSSHGRRRGGGGRAGGRGITSAQLPDGHPVLQRFGHDTENYREFNDPTTADSAMTRMYQPWADSLTDEERNAVRGYQQQTFDTVNGTLRGQRPNDEKTAGARREIEKIDSALDSAAVPYNVTVFRGFVNPNLPAGTVFEDAGYGSTTFAPNIAASRAVAHGNQGAVARIRVPQGTNGAYIETVTAIDQAELLLHRGTKYRVLGTTRGRVGDHDTTIVDLEVVG